MLALTVALASIALQLLPDQPSVSATPPPVIGSSLSGSPSPSLSPSASPSASPAGSGGPSVVQIGDTRASAGSVDDQCLTGVKVDFTAPVSVGQLAQPTRYSYRLAYTVSGNTSLRERPDSPQPGAPEKVDTVACSTSDVNQFFR